MAVHAELDLSVYEKGLKISGQRIKELETSQLHHHQFHGDWNYTLDPATPESGPPQLTVSL